VDVVGRLFVQERTAHVSLQVYLAGAFCKCMAQDNCQNPHTKHDDDVSVDDVTRESDDDNYD